MDNSLNYKLSLKDLSFKKGLTEAAGLTKNLDSNMNKLEKTAGRVGRAVAGYFALSSIKNFGLSVLDSLKNYEMFSASLRTLMYGDGQASKALEGQLIKLASTTPFSLTDVQDGTKQLIAYGFQAGTVVKNMKMLGDISSGVGSPLNDIVYLYGTLRTQGRAYTKDIMQFTSRGIPIIGQLAKQFGVTESKVKDLVEAGRIGFPQIERAFKDMTSEGGQFAGMMDNMSKTVGGKLSNLGDSWEQLKVGIGKSQTGIINATITWTSELVSEMSKVISQANRIDEAFANMKLQPRGGFRGFFETINPVMKKFTAGLYGFGGAGGSLIQNLDNSIQGILSKNSENGKLGELTSRAQLLKLQAGYSKSFAGGKISKQDYNEASALIKSSLEQVAGNLKLLTVPTSKELAEKGGKSVSSSIGAATEVSGSRPQNIVINLDRLGDVTINGTTITEDAKQVKDIWSKELLEVLNDANLIAGR